MSWFQQNLSTILISAALLLLMAAIVVSRVRARKKGKSTCGCGCAECAMHSACQGAQGAKTKL